MGSELQVCVMRVFFRVCDGATHTARSCIIPEGHF